jgi:hypothetical protein
MENGRKVAAAVGIAATATAVGGRDVIEGIFAFRKAPQIFEEATPATFAGARTGSRQFALSELGQEARVDSGELGGIPYRVRRLPEGPRIVFADPYRYSSEQTHVHNIIEGAKSSITSDLSGYGDLLTRDVAEQAIRTNFVKVVEEQAKSDPNISFELLTGKLKIDSSLTFAGAKISLGEVNMYKIASVAAVGVVACKGLHASQFQSCVDAALAKASTATFGAMGSKE